MYSNAIGLGRLAKLADHHRTRVQAMETDQPKRGSPSRLRGPTSQTDLTSERSW